MLSSSSETDTSVVVVEFRREAEQIKAFSVKTILRDSCGLDLYPTASRFLNDNGVFGWKIAGRRKLELIVDNSVADSISGFRRRN